MGVCVFALLSLVTIINASKILNENGALKVGSVPIGAHCTDNSDCVGDPGVTSQCTVGHGDSIEKCWCMPSYLPKSDLMDCLKILDNIDDQCVEAPQCQQGKLGDLSHCVKEECKCKPEAVKVSRIDYCLPKLYEFNDRCEATEQCIIGTGATCDINSECNCDNVKGVSNRAKTKCLEVLNRLGQPCAESVQCQKGAPGDLSECGAKLTCECKSDAVPPTVGERCILKSGYDQECIDSSQCKATLGDLAVCNPSTLKCDCQATAVINGAKDKCLPKVHELGEVCEESIQCISGVPGPLSDCLPTSDDATKLVCQCTDKAVELPGEHHCFAKAIKIGDDCKHDEQCTENIDFSYCSSEDGDTCRCIDDTVPSEDLMRCLRGEIPIGKPCEDSNQCSGNSKCSASKHCACNDMQVPKLDLSDCLPIANDLRTVCEQDDQCQRGPPGEYSMCADDGTGVNMCLCKSDAVAIINQKKCFKKATHVEDSCEYTEQCAASLEQSYCTPIEGKCRCNEAAVPSTGGDKCLLKVDLHSPCIDDAQCDHILYSASCQPRNPENPGGLRVCSCTAGHNAIPDDGKICYRMATQIGDPCKEHDEQCQLLSGANCLVVEEGEKECLCDLKTEVASENRMRCLQAQPSLGGTCEESVQCIKENVDCTYNETNDMSYCLCKNSNFIPSEDVEGNCIEIRREINLPCTEPLQCTEGLGNLSVCHQERCQCGLRYAYYDGWCYLGANLGEICHVNAECYVGINNNTFCDPGSSRCRCIKGTINFGEQCWYNKRVGDRCESDEECSITILGLSYCDPFSKRCSCHIGHKPDFNNLACVSGSPAKIKLPQLTLSLSFLALLLTFLTFE